MTSSPQWDRPAPDPWQIDPLPATLRAEDCPLGSLSDGTKATLNALRARPFGATAAKLAELSGVSYSQTLRCLARLEQRGWAKAAKTSIHYGYELRRATVWSLSWSDGCMHALSYLRDRPTRPIEQIPDRVPRRVWRNFWSGASADTLTISQHGLHIAETLIGGHDISARAWALSNLPTPVLRECHTLRGFGCSATTRPRDAGQRSWSTPGSPSFPTECAIVQSMTTSDALANPQSVFVWVWLPAATEGTTPESDCADEFGRDL